MAVRSRIEINAKYFFRIHSSKGAGSTKITIAEITSYRMQSHLLWITFEMKEIRVGNFVIAFNATFLYLLIV